MDQSDEFSFLQDIHLTNGWHLHLPKAYCTKNRTAGTFRRVKSLETYQAGTSNIIMLKSDFKETL